MNTIIIKRADGQSLEQYKEDRSTSTNEVRQYLKKGTLFYSSISGEPFVGKCDREKMAKTIERNSNLAAHLGIKWEA